MKKILFMVLVFVFFIPFKTNAMQIDSLSMTGNVAAKVGEQVTITLEAPTSNYNPNEGIWIVYANLMYDTKYLALTQISSPGYTTVVSYNETGALLFSEVIDNASVSGMCVSGLLHCGTYSLVLKFQVINVTQSTNVSISTTEFGIGTLVIDEAREYTLDDAIETVYPNPVSHNLVLDRNVISIEEKPIVVPETKPNNETKKPIVVKSNNNYLKSLDIKDHKIDFNKTTTNYNVTIASDVNSLVINPISEHSLASYKVTGNENLKNGSIIKITVTAEDGETREYKINVKKEKPVSIENSSESIIETKQEDVKQNIYNFDKKMVKIVIGIGGFFVVIGLIYMIINIRDNRKIDKLLEEEK